LPCGKDVIARLMHEAGYSLQGMAKVLEGKQLRTGISSSGISTLVSPARPGRASR
jgi:hypothetical protein